MKTKHTFLAFALYAITMLPPFGGANGLCQTFQWAKSMGGTSDDFGQSIAIDASGNVFAAGYFQGTVDFDPGPGTFSLTSGGSKDIFISKLDVSGNFLWAKQLGGASDDYGQSIALDASGNVYTTGFFQGTVDFDPGLGTFNLTSAGIDDIFISKLDASGNFLWAKRLGGTGYDWGYSIALDASGNVYTTGKFDGTADFDPGPGTFTLTPAGWADIFISKLDASGNFIWAIAMGGPLDQVGQSITIDASGNVYTTGVLINTADFDPGPGTFTLTAAGADIFISKLDASGNFLWAKQLGGTGSNAGNFVTLDASGNVYTTGYFQGTGDFDPGPGTFTLTTAGAYDIFISKLDASGNFLWAKQLGGALTDVGNSIATDASGNVYTFGKFDGTVDFDPGPGTFNLFSAGGAEIFISKLDVSGNFLWAKQLGGASDDYGQSMALDASGNIYTTGEFKGTADFDPGPGTFTLTSAGVYDIFISKLSGSTTGLAEVFSIEHMKIFPNPGKGKFNVQMNPESFRGKNVRLAIYNVLGEKITQSVVPNEASLPSGQEENFSVDLSSSPNGIYFLQLTTEQGITTHKIIKE